MKTVERDYYTVQEIADMLKLTRQAIDKRIKRLKVPFKRFGRTRVIKTIDAELLNK